MRQALVQCYASKAAISKYFDLACSVLFLLSTPSLRWVHFHRLHMVSQLSILLTTHTLLSGRIRHDSTIISRVTSSSNCHNLEYLFHDTSVSLVKRPLQVVGVGGRSCSADYSAVMPDNFTEQSVSGEEYAQLGKHVKSVKVDPPERWSAEEEVKSQQL